MPTHPPARRALPSALLLSLVAHAIAAGFVFQAWRDARPAPSVSRQKGALQVTLRRDAAPPAKAAAPPSERNAAAPVPRKQRARGERPAAAPKPGPTTAPATVAIAPVPAPATDEPKPGARFASLFAPITHAPMGQGRWMSSQRAAPAAALPPQQQREQALMALRAALAARFATLAEQLRAAHAQIACELVIDIERHIGQIDCDDHQQQALAWGHLQGTLAAGLVSDAAQRLCLRLSGQQVLDTGCATPPTP
jgi:DNA-binding transcriptional regulator YdaS (Cro superfamily)